MSNAIIGLLVVIAIAVVLIAYTCLAVGSANDDWFNRD